MKEQRVPVKEDLDAAAPNNPVVLTRAGGHSGVGNSMALEDRRHRRARRRTHRAA